MKYRTAIRRSLQSLVFAAAVSLTGCDQGHPEYHIDTTIDGEKVTCYDITNPHMISDKYMLLKVTKKDNSVVRFWDQNRDLVLDRFSIQEEHNTKVYTRARHPQSSEDRQMLAGAEEQYCYYLAKIIEMKKALSEPQYR